MTKKNINQRLEQLEKIVSGNAPYLTPRWLSMDDAAQAIGVSYWELRGMVLRGEANVTRLTPRGKYRFTPEEIERLKKSEKKVSVK